MEVIITLWIVTASLAWWGLLSVGILLVAGVAFSNKEQSGEEVVLFGLIAVATTYAAWGFVSIGAAIAFIAYYLLLGAIWSILINARTTIKAMKSDKKNSHIKSLEYYLDMVSFGRSIRWVLYWPFSILNYIFGDLIVSTVTSVVNFVRDINKKITTYFYNKIMK